MTSEQRSSVQDKFMTSGITAIVSTNAFGMGINKPDVRLLVLWKAPKTMEMYLQQIGRAGRDGKPSKCLMFTKSADFTRECTCPEMRSSLQEPINACRCVLPLVAARRVYC
jgi:superfamily II DNA helicase RecQ